MAKNKIIFVNNEKKIDKTEEEAHNKDIGEIQSTEKAREFLPEVKAYVPYFNPSLNLYEMFTVFIDPISGESKLERLILKHDSPHRAVMEMQKLYSDDYIRKAKEQHKKETKKG